MTKPLDGLRVLDLTRVLAGPYATMMLADMGAEVIKIENPQGGDDSRAFAPFKNKESAYFISLNRSKKSVTLNLKNPKAKQMLKDMVKQADILVENYKPGAMKKLGLDYEVLREINPRLIYAASSGFGQTGPYSSRPAYDLIVQGMGGLMSITGFDAEHPVKVGSSVADIFVGIFTTIGILAALESRRKTGRGQMVDVAMLDCLVATLENALARYECTGISPVPIGNAHPSIAPFATLPTAKGFINVAVGNDVLWGRFCDICNVSEIKEDARFVDNRNRVANWNELKPILESVFHKKTTEEWMTLLGDAQIPVGPIYNIEQVVNDPQIKAREMIVNMEHPIAGSMRVPGFPIKFSDTPAGISSVAPLLGEHTAEIFGKYLSLSEEQIASLKEEGVL